MSAQDDGGLGGLEFEFHTVYPGISPRKNKITEEGSHFEMNAGDLPTTQFQVAVPTVPYHKKNQARGEPIC